MWPPCDSGLARMSNEVICRAKLDNLVLQSSTKIGAENKRYFDPKGSNPALTTGATLSSSLSRG